MLKLIDAQIKTFYHLVLGTFWVLYWKRNILSEKAQTQTNYHIQMSDRYLDDQKKILDQIVEHFYGY